MSDSKKAVSGSFAGVPTGDPTSGSLPPPLPNGRLDVSKGHHRDDDVVPQCPVGLLVRREDFLGDGFSVDAFLARKMALAVHHRADQSSGVGGHHALERLADDLGAYLKVLRSAMIELINDDYADFVNLSADLAGLEGAAAGLGEPLRSYRSATQSAAAAVEGTALRLGDLLARKGALHRKRVGLQNLELIAATLNKTERRLNLLNQDQRRRRRPSGDDEDTGDDRGLAPPELVERVAADVHHLNFCMAKVKDLAPAFVRLVRPRLEVIVSRIHSSMEAHLLTSVRASFSAGADLAVTAAALKRSLRTYATVDRVADAEDLVRRSVVAPFLDDVLTEASLTSDPRGLRGVWARVARIWAAPGGPSDDDGCGGRPLASATTATMTTVNLWPLLEVTSGSDARNHRCSTTATTTSKQQLLLREFDFMGRSLWPEIAERFEDNLASQFSAGDPDRFHANYSHTMDFLAEFERRLQFAEALEAFRRDPSYLAFVSRWNLAVYFQIRFQEIALPLEQALVLHHPQVAEVHDESTGGDAACRGKRDLRLPASRAVMATFRRIWDPMVFLPALFQRFWRLTLQVVARYGRQAVVVVVVRNGGDAGFSIQEDNDPVAHHAELVRLHLDLGDLSTYLTEEFLSDVVHPVISASGLPTSFPPTDSQPEGGLEDVLVETLAEASGILHRGMRTLSDRIVGGVADCCRSALNQVADIPRLYRRTNRDLPTKPCGYVASTLQPLLAFYRGSVSGRDSDDRQLHTWCLSIVEKVTRIYSGHVSEVLTAVQKMEESLRRLKRVRDHEGGSSAAAAGGAQAPAESLLEGSVAPTAKVISDDDRIRLQLYVDVGYFVQQVEAEVRVRPDEVDGLVHLLQLVQDATKGCFDDYSAKVSTANV